MFFRQVVDPYLSQYAYLIGCQQTGEAIVIDPERDVDRYLKLAAAEGLKLVAATETHIHADFLSGVRQLAFTAGTRSYLSSEGGPDWSYAWATSGDREVQLLADGDEFHVGKIEFRAVHTPGHTPEHMSFLVTDRGGGATEPMGLVSGDFVFVGDLGRPDLLESAAGKTGAMEPAARSLFGSLQEFLSLPDYLQVWPGHGAGSACGKALGAVPDSTVGYERRFNASIRAADGGEAGFVQAILEGQPEPPLYFGRMKAENKHGPALLERMPSPLPVDIGEMYEVGQSSEAVILDTRRDRSGFHAAHLPGSIHAPFDKTLPTIAGSYVDAYDEIYLVAEESELDEIVRNLIRIGLDRIQGFCTPEMLASLEGDRRGRLAQTPEIGFLQLLATRSDGETAGSLVLDVRRQTEFEAGHLPGALNVAHTRLKARLNEIPKDRKLVVHCASGIRASAAVSFLSRNGHEVAYVNDLFAKVPRTEVVTAEQVEHV